MRNADVIMTMSFVNLIVNNAFYIFVLNFEGKICFKF